MGATSHPSGVGAQVETYSRRFRDFRAIPDELLGPAYHDIPGHVRLQRQDLAAQAEDLGEVAPFEVADGQEAVLGDRRDLGRLFPPEQLARARVISTVVPGKFETLT